MCAWGLPADAEPLTDMRRTATHHVCALPCYSTYSSRAALWARSIKGVAIDVLRACAPQPLHAGGSVWAGSAPHHPLGADALPTAAGHVQPTGAPQAAAAAPVPGPPPEHPSSSDGVAPGAARPAAWTSVGALEGDAAGAMPGASGSSAVDLSLASDDDDGSGGGVIDLSSDGDAGSRKRCAVGGPSHGAATKRAARGGG
eukprot:62319-Chlamydomonas_euryale.AAC.1